MEFDKYDEFICKTMLSVIGAVQLYYKFRYRDLFAQKQVGLITEEEYIEKLRNNDYFEDTKKYYNSLCTKELEKIGFVDNNESFDRIYEFNTKILKIMENRKYEDIKPLIIKYLIPKNEYQEIKDKLRRTNEEEYEESVQ